jgi:hypothetical protein
MEVGENTVVIPDNPDRWLAKDSTYHGDLVSAEDVANNRQWRLSNGGLMLYQTRPDYERMNPLYPELNWKCHEPEGALEL